MCILQDVLTFISECPDTQTSHDRPPVMSGRPCQAAFAVQKGRPAIAGSTVTNAHATSLLMILLWVS